ncbi:MAG: hypothetical protein ACRD51_13245 [Candidatus Acidiferrum sp.]
MTESEWMEQFEECALPNGFFHHQDHARMAFLYLKKYPALEALDRFSSALKRFATAQGKPNIYCETITWCYFLLIRERMARANSPQTWADFSAENTDLLCWKDNLLHKFYRPETLKSELGRRVFVFPDRLQPDSTDGLQ